MNLFLITSGAPAMTEYGIVMPIFAMRLGDAGFGVTLLGLMTMAFAARQFLMAPFTIAAVVAMAAMAIAVIGLKHLETTHESVARAKAVV